MTPKSTLALVKLSNTKKKNKSEIYFRFLNKKEMGN